MVRFALPVLLIAAALSGAPARAADLAGGLTGTWARAVHAEPLLVYDYEPGIEVSMYWLRPWAGRHYFPSGGKRPVLGRREQIAPTPVSEKRDFHREWQGFPVDTIQQPPLILNQQQYFPSTETAPPVSK